MFVSVGLLRRLFLRNKLGVAIHGELSLKVTNFFFCVCFSSGVLQCVSTLLNEVLTQLLFYVCGWLLLKESTWRVLVALLKTNVVNSPLSRNDLQPR